jgi:hypothetical protein
MLRKVGYDKYTSEKCNASHVIVAQVCVMKSLTRLSGLTLTGILAVGSRVITVTFAEAPRRRLMQTLMVAVLCWHNLSTEMIGEMIVIKNQCVAGVDVVTQ